MTAHIQPWQIPLGAELCASHGVHFHHAPYVGEGLVAHLCGLERKDNETAEIRVCSFEEFSGGRQVEVLVDEDGDDAGSVAVSRALTVVGRKGHDLFKNNCGHFVRWCKSGNPSSRQVAAVASVAIVAGAVLPAAAVAS